MFVTLTNYVTVVVSIDQYKDVCFQRPTLEAVLCGQRVLPYI